MKALHFDGRELRMTEKETPVRKPGQSLLKVEYAGVCNTDLEILKGYMNFRGTPGHEFVGTVVASDHGGFVGKKVVVEINYACGNCAFCARGMGRHCPDRTVMGIDRADGVFAEYVLVPQNNLHVVPPDVGDLQAVFCEPLAAGCEILEQLEILPEYRVLLIGDGKLAQLVARVIQLKTEKLRVVGKHPEKLQKLKDLGIHAGTLESINPDDHAYDVVVEATGSWRGWEMAGQFVKPRGFIVLKSTYAGEKLFNPSMLVINEVTVIGSRCGSFADALHLLQKNAVDPTDLISEIFPFAEWEAAFALAKSSESLKVLLKF